MAALTSIPPAILRGIAPLRTTPAEDASSVFRTHITVTAIQRRPDGSQYLAVTTGNVGLRAWLPPGSPPVEHGKAYTIEQHKGAHPLFDPFTAIYPAGEAPPERNPSMNQIAPAAAQAVPLTMTSREIAALTGKPHGNVMRDIRAMISDISMNSNLNPCAKSSTYVGKDGRQYAQYELDKDTCLTLLLGYDAAARMKVVKRWQELEFQATQPTFNIPQTQIGRAHV